MANIKNKTFLEACAFLDWQDKETLAVISTVNESEQNTVSVQLAKHLYDVITDKAKYANIDFAEIPKTKGDISKTNFHKELHQNIDSLEEAVKALRLNKEQVVILKESLRVLEENRKVFQEAYTTKNTILSDIYSFTVLSLLAATALTSSILANYYTSTTTVNTSVITKDYDALLQNPLFKHLKQFIALEKNKGFQTLGATLGEDTKKTKTNLIGTVAAGAGIAILVFNFVDILREVVYYFLYAKASVAEYFQSLQLQLAANAYKLRDKDKQAADIQEGIADNFGKLANKLKVDDRQANSKAEKESKKDSKTKVKYSDLSDTLPDSTAASSSSLF